MEAMIVDITYTQLCAMPRLERSSTAPEKREIFVIHMLSLYTPLVAAFLFDSRLTDSFARHRYCTRRNDSSKWAIRIRKL